MEQHDSKSPQEKILTTEQKEEAKQQASTIAKWSGLAFQMLAAIGLGVWAGLWLDKKLEMKLPIFTIVLSLLGVLVSMFQVYRQAVKEQ